MRSLITGMLAVIVGSTIISTGVFLGLKQQTVVQVMAPTVDVRSAAPVQAPPAIVDTVIEQRVAKRVRELMEERRAELARACKTDVASPVNLEFRLIFNADGKLISYAVNDPPDQAMQKIAQCVRGQRPDLSIEAPGRPATAQFFLAI